MPLIVGLKEELMFWTQIFGDHSRFIYHNLSPAEVNLYSQAQNFIVVFDRLYQLTQSTEEAGAMNALKNETLSVTQQLRSFKLLLLSLHLQKRLISALNPTFINHMLNELDRGYEIISRALPGQTVLPHPVSQHLLWILDAVGHAETVYCDLDPTQADLRKKFNKFKKTFEKLYLATIEFAGFARTNPNIYPALHRFDRTTGEKTLSFMNLLEKVRNEILAARVIGSIQALSADHMAREECYYLLKLHLADPGEVPAPNCIPWRQRVEG